jgi:hypothetical protein
VGLITPKSHDRNMSPLEVVDLHKINICAPITQLVECAAVNYDFDAISFGTAKS